MSTDPSGGGPYRTPGVPTPTTEKKRDFLGYSRMMVDLQIAQMEAEARQRTHDREQALHPVPILLWEYKK
jgi:hypothetical protein